MRALSRGERRASVGVVLGLVGVLALLLSTLALTLSYRGQLIELKGTIVSRCEQRQAYDRANNDSVRADAILYQQLLDITAKAPAQTDPKIVALVEEQKRVITQARDRKQQAADAGVVGSCNQYR